MDHRRTKRPLPLLALPAFATDGGGGDALRGAVLQRLHDVAADAAAAHGVDVAMVLRGPADLAVLQRPRRRAQAADWTELGQLVGTAQALAGRAQSGVLVPFIGAGVSASAGLPLWKELVSRLKAAVHLPEDEAASFEQLDVLDQAHVLRLLNASGGIDFPAAVARETESTRYGLAPILLAALPTREAVTLNYDTLYERASEDVGRPVASLPEEVVKPGERWLLKLHGSVTDPASIVLTRDDYLGYRRGREALSSLAKAMLLTKHLLFVGFGLADDHFHALMHDVRAVLPAEKRGGAKLGTALVLGHEPLQQRLWGDEIDLVPLQGEDVGAQARLLEVFLDCVLAHAEAKSPFFLDPRYSHDMPAPERTLRDRLLDLSRDLTAEESALAAWQPVRLALEELGLPSGSRGRGA